MLPILVIEDDLEVHSHIVKCLHDAGYKTDSAYDGEEALQMALKNQYRVIIVDRMLPKLDGLAIISHLRERDHFTPALILSALGEVDHRVEGLKAGGDDYLVKPFASVELIARIEVLSRRGQPATHSEIMLGVGDLVMDVLARKVSRGGETILLQAREFKLLEYLLRHKNQIVTRTMLLEHVWDYHFDPQTNVIDVHISRLRQKIDKDPQNSLIKTIRGSGYIIEDAEAAAA